jgi:phosphonate transport system substrate-binding protein
MLSKKNHLILFFSIILTALPVSAATTITLGSISDDPTRELKYYLPIANYLAKELKAEGIEEAYVLVAEDIQQISRFLKEKRVDIYFDSPFPAAEAHRLSGSIPILRRWKNGVSHYHSVIFVRQDSDITSSNDLSGKLLAFEEPYSTGSYYLPKASLSNLGMNLVEKTHSNPQNDTTVGYEFSGDDINSLVWVLSGRIDAGAMSYNNLNRLASKQLKKLRVIHSTIAVPRHIVSIRSDLDPVLASKIKNILLQMHSTKRGQKILQQFKKTTKFDEIPKGADAMLESLQQLSSSLQKDSQE